jgi:hypothetical protein
VDARPVAQREGRPGGLPKRSASALSRPSARLDVARRVRIVREVTPTDAQLRHFAADRVEGALVYADPEWRETLEVVIHTVRAYADGAASDAELTAAGAAASAAARGAFAAWAAAAPAAGAAAGAAARGAFAALIEGDSA